MCERRTIDTEGVVGADGCLIIQMPGDIAPGTHRVHLVIDDLPLESVTGTDALGLTTFDVPWPADFSLRREDLYDDRGR